MLLFCYEAGSCGYVLYRQLEKFLMGDRINLGYTKKDLRTQNTILIFFLRVLGVLIYGRSVISKCLEGDDPVLSW